jgi:hypothetical protein
MATRAKPPKLDGKKAIPTKHSAIAWLDSGDVGMSSQSIWFAMMGHTQQYVEHPSDSDDFGRCYRLLQRFPEWRWHLDRMATKSETWKEMHRRWPEMERLYEAKSYTMLYRVLQECRGLTPLPDGATRVTVTFHDGRTKRKKGDS